MANEIRATYDSGQTLYALIFNAAGQVWLVGPSNWTAYIAANVGDYDIPLSEIATNSGQYRGTFPAAAAGVYSVVLFLQAGGSPASTDERIGDTGVMHWDGSAEITISDLPDVESNIRGPDSDTLKTLSDQIDTVGSEYRLGLTASYDGTTVKVGLWLEENGQRQTDVTSITDVEIFNAATDALAVDLGDDVADSSDGVFYLSGSASLAYNTPYYVKATVNKGGDSYSMQAGLVRI